MGFEQQGRCNGAGPVPFWLQGIPSSPRARKAKGRDGGIVTDSMKMVYIYPVIFQKMPKLPAETDWGSKFHHSLKLFAKIWNLSRMQRVCTFLQSHPMAVFYDYISYKGPSYTYCHHSSCFAKGPIALPLGATRSQHPRFDVFFCASKYRQQQHQKGYDLNQCTGRMPGWIWKIPPEKPDCSAHCPTALSWAKHHECGSVKIEQTRVNGSMEL